jgi:mannitol/fructose-specific phosphotransferase system IIA component (Ntr-type)
MMGGSKGRQMFLGNLANTLGVTEEKLEQAFKDAAEKTVEQAEKDGYLTPAQSQQIRERIATGRSGGPFGRPWIMIARMHQTVSAVLDAVASRLGMTAKDLESRLASGTKMGDLLREKGLSEAELRQTVVDTVRHRLDEAVHQGRITPKFADAVIHRIEESPTFSKAA